MNSNTKGWVAVWLLWVFTLSSGCVSVPRFDTLGEVAGQKVNTTVDSPLASYYLASYLQGHRWDTQLTQTIDQALEEFDPQPHDTEGLRQLAQRLSTDFATIHFVARLYEHPANQRIQDAFHALVDQTTADIETFVVPDTIQRYVIAFVPGYAYQTNTANGADLASQRSHGGISDHTGRD